MVLSGISCEGMRGIYLMQFSMLWCNDGITIMILDRNSDVTG